MDSILMFSTCQRRSCVDVAIIDDVTLENTELFSVTLERTRGRESGLVLSPVDGEIEIIDGVCER